MSKLVVTVENAPESHTKIDDLEVGTVFTNQSGDFLMITDSVSNRLERIVTNVGERLAVNLETGESVWCRNELCTPAYSARLYVKV